MNNIHVIEISIEGEPKEAQRATDRLIEVLGAEFKGMKPTVVSNIKTEIT